MILHVLISKLWIEYQKIAKVLFDQSLLFTNSISVKLYHSQFKLKLKLLV